MSVRRSSAWLACLLCTLGAGGCHSTLDSLGCTERKLDPDGGTPLGSLLVPASYPNPFRDLLNKSDSEIAARVSAAYDQLFHGDPNNEAIFVTKGPDMAYIRDVLHDEVRTEGISIGMLIAVELDHRDDFDRLWRYAKYIQIPTGAAQGYLPSFCNAADESTVDCNDPYGLAQIATALLIARGRWQDTPGSIDYGSEAGVLLDVLRNHAAFTCGIGDGVTDVFDESRKLPYATPTPDSAGISRPSIVMPAYYDLWWQATGDPFWSDAAAAARAYWKASAHPTTGLLPEQAGFDGTPVPGFEIFKPECDRAFFNMALDRIWSGSQPWVVDESNHVLQFFYGQGLTTYGQQFSLDGKTVVATLHDMPLVAANGVLALAATNSNRRDFVNEVWVLTMPTGNARYYSGIMQMLALVFLSGQMQVY